MRALGIATAHRVRADLARVELRVGRWLPWGEDLAGFLIDVFRGFMRIFGKAGIREMRVGSMGAIAFAVAISGAVAPVAACPGDCDGDRRVSIAELVRGVRCALGLLASSVCDGCYSADVDIAQLALAVRGALDGCPLSTATPLPTPTPVGGNCITAVVPQTSFFVACTRDPDGLSGSFTLETTGDECCWTTRLRRGFPFVTVSPPTSGCGNATVTYRVPTNNGPAVGNEIEILNESGTVVAQHNVRQASHCTRTASPRTPTPRSVR